MSAVIAPEAALTAPVWPHFDDAQRQAVNRVLQSGKVNYWTGTEGRQFESEFAAAVGLRHGVAVANGSLALELALYAAKVGHGDEVIVTPRSFIASASSVVLAGARPVFADVDRDSQNLTAATIEAVLTPATRAIIVVHLGGWPAAMDDIMELAGDRGLVVIEDCAQSHGAYYRGVACGAWGDMASYSFCQDKIMTTGGEGGLLLTNESSLFERAWSYKDHGKDRATIMTPSEQPGFRWVHHSFGSNWRLTEMQSAIGRVQLTLLPEWVRQRQDNAAYLIDRLSGVKALRIPQPEAGVDHAYYRLYAFVRPQLLRPGWDRDRILAKVVAGGVRCFSGSCGEIYLEPAFRDAGLGPEKPLPVAAELAATSLAFEVDPGQTRGRLEALADRLLAVFDEAGL